MTRLGRWKLRRERGAGFLRGSRGERGDREFTISGEAEGVRRDFRDGAAALCAVDRAGIGPDPEHGPLPRKGGADGAPGLFPGVCRGVAVAAGAVVCGVVCFAVYAASGELAGGGGTKLNRYYSFVPMGLEDSFTM